ncbi:MAG: CotH kinase family protein [Oscillospiraceae bacterium]|nr:CotH kinase family protein [Oscillospiraceae bacterium]
MSFGGGRGNGKDFDMNDFMGNTDASGNSDQNTATPQMPDMGNMDPSQTQGGFGGAMNNAGDAGFSQMPGGMAQGDFGNGDNSTVGGRGDFSFRVDEETLRAAFEKLEIDLSLLDGVDFENITTETFRSLLSSLDEKTIQALMQEIMGNVSFDRDGFGGDGMGGMGMGSSDVKLQYVDDNIDSYSNIWNNAKTDITEADQTRLIESLEKLSNGEQIESVVDIEQVIRYFVVHNYVCNGDSYTGSMIHNYYLYEENGQLAMIPWDYNLAFGTFQGSNAQSTVNTPIDSPIDGGSAEDRPMWNWIISNENYTELYHQYFAEFLNTVDINGIIDNAYNLIKSYVEKDPTAFYTYEEFELGVETLRQFCSLRSQSISMQLENGETTSDMSYADASDLNLSDMGSMNMRGGGMQNMGGKRSNFDNTGEREPNMHGIPDTSTESVLDAKGTSAATSGGMFQNLSNSMPSDIPEGFTGEMPEGFDPSQMPEGFDASQRPVDFNGDFPGQSSDRTETTPSTDSDSFNNTDSSKGSNRPSDGNIQMPSRDFSSMGAASSSSVGWIWITVSVLILGIGLIIAKKYKY